MCSLYRCAQGASIQGFGALPPAPCLPSPAILEKAADSRTRDGVKSLLEIPLQQQGARQAPEQEGAHSTPSITT